MHTGRAACLAQLQSCRPAARLPATHIPAIDLNIRVPPGPFGPFRFACHVRSAPVKRPTPHPLPFSSTRPCFLPRSAHRCMSCKVPNVTVVVGVDIQGAHRIGHPGVLCTEQNYEGVRVSVLKNGMNCLPSSPTARPHATAAAATGQAPTLPHFLRRSPATRGPFCSSAVSGLPGPRRRAAPCTTRAAAATRPPPSAGLGPPPAGLGAFA